MRYLVTFLMVASLTMFSLGCGGEKTKPKKTNGGEKPAASETKEAK